MSDGKTGGCTAVVLVVNGDYGRDLVETAEVLVGGLDVHVVETVCHANADDLRRRVRHQVLDMVGQTESVLLVTDLCGSTPANVCLELLLKHPGWELLTGLNLPMLLKLATCDRSARAQEMAQQLGATAAASIKLGTPFLPEESTRGD
jgi:mannose PTS system EIIA component